MLNCSDEKLYVIAKSNHFYNLITRRFYNLSISHGNGIKATLAASRTIKQKR